MTVHRALAAGSPKRTEHLFVHIPAQVPAASQFLQCRPVRQALLDFVGSNDPTIAHQHPFNDYRFKKHVLVLTRTRNWVVRVATSNMRPPG